MNAPIAARIVCAAVAMQALYTLCAAADDANAPPNAYRGLVPGRSTLAEVVEQLGPATIETAGDHDLRYPAAGNPKLSDRLFFRGDTLALVTAASDDPRYATRAAIVQRFGRPEAQIDFRTQHYLDYTERGLRFICAAAGETTGVIYFPPARRRVPAGFPNTHIDLRKALSPPADVAAPRGFLVGAAQVSIAPERFDNLSADGAEKPAHLAEDLLARAVVFQRGEVKIAIVGLDVFGLGPWDIDRIRKALAERGFDNVIVAMSHTHANADTIGFYGYYPRQYAARIVQQSEAVVVRAAERLAPIRRLQMGSAEMPLAGGRVVDLIRNGRDPGVVDPTVSIIQAIGDDGQPVANLIHLACHPEVIRLSETRGLSPDFVGALCKRVTERLGGQTVFLNGALGGMLTPDTRFRTQAAAEQMGAALAEWVVKAAGDARPATRYDLWLRRRPLEIPMTAEPVKTFLENAPEPFEIHEGRAPTEMNVVWIGDAQLITVPGELLPDLGFEIMSHMRGEVRLIVGLANGEFGYLVPSFDFRAGGYEERTGPGAAGGPIVRSAGLELAPLLPPARSDAQ